MIRYAAQTPSNATGRVAAFFRFDVGGRLKQNPRRILFSRNPLEFDVETGMETRRLGMQLSQMGFRHTVLPAHLANHELRIATDQVCVPRLCFSLKLVEGSKQEDERLEFRNIVAGRVARSCEG